ncbi:MAG: Soluble lytic murein transglycosylase and related regulatory proteins (some contain LysM/invasin domains) [uncultured Paraburkholderia sp.]|uniref:lytic transglycosylase domain-containing protein n=1 Tax=uncultured Paraburkholderia sp. TaxID=1822466 RepID=UPI00259299FA|nr:lytic transglycosylase domain-containing protein [uncultured Paraburkholderia sp.]CAH2902094.1 MAG: Soluble lytic murein transglycosylase and related regulatory proteins (some contain LysM/invasin domains) [uncultured Paraburkholderia sp.]CAH2936549.1 MAG: Soluble lytic murein transglycosylase and related regulatory proteins (some contain LysM/invasin domains) [uncultured Paraburkholderia sp.]
MKRVWIVPAGAVMCGLAFSCRADCIDDAAQFHHVNVRLVRAIATVESGQHANVVHVNTDGSTDIGLMQINSRWLATLSRFGVSRADLHNRCTNAYVGAWILSQTLRRLGLSWDAVGAYNAGTHEKRMAYARRVYQALNTVGSSTSAPAAAPTTQAPGLIAKLFQPLTWGGDQ